MNLSFATGSAKEINYSINTLCTGVECGITFFDTAEAYGPFTNEELVGAALKPFRKDVIIATKFGMTSDIGINSQSHTFVKLLSNHYKGNKQTT